MEDKNIIGTGEMLVLPYQSQMLSNVGELLYPPTPKKLKGYVVKPVRDSKTDPKINRNDFCPCGSGLKYKKCCNGKQKEKE